MRKSVYETAFLQWLADEGDIPAPQAEYVFAPPRRWRFDFAWPEMGFAVEIDGGLFVAGRHSRGAGIIADAEKYEAALMRGWRVYRIPGQWIVRGRKDVRRPEVMQTIRAIVGAGPRWQLRGTSASGSLMVQLG